MKHKTTRHIVFTALATLLALACFHLGHRSVRAETQDLSPAPEQLRETESTLSEGAAMQRVPLPASMILEVADGVAVLRGVDGEVLARNSRVVRGMDPDGRCPADGFVQAIAVDSGFELHNQLCSGWFIITEIMTFAPASEGYFLVRFAATYTDRRTAEPVGAPRVLTQKELGARPFNDLNPDDLYLLLE